eukprot:366510-Chlamydomonas_euryale.AAC.31
MATGGQCGLMPRDKLFRKRWATASTYHGAWRKARHARSSRLAAREAEHQNAQKAERRERRSSRNTSDAPERIRAAPSALHALQRACTPYVRVPARACTASPPVHNICRRSTSSGQLQLKGQARLRRHAHAFAPPPAGRHGKQMHPSNCMSSHRAGDQPVRLADWMMAITGVSISVCYGCQLKRCPLAQKPAAKVFARRSNRHH